jgi:hypothetical protein
MSRIWLITAVFAIAASTTAAPLIPPITMKDFAFGAFNADNTIEYRTNGGAADTLTFTRNAADHEVSAFWPDWPAPPMLPVLDLNTTPGFGGDLVLGAQFTGQDAPIGSLDVSLTGTGFHVAQAAADLEIWGTIIIDSNTTLSGLLWAIDLDQVSLYGHSNSMAYVLEGLGSIVGGEVPTYYDLPIGSPAAMRGDLDFIDRPAGWMPALYAPLAAGPDLSVRADYSGETGLVPEPAALGVFLGGLLTLRRRR